MSAAVVTFDGHGLGDGTFTPDGCAVEFYASLPKSREVELLAPYLDRARSILDLGCGTGRLTNAFVDLASVVQVDWSADMLAHACGRAVLGRIEEFDDEDTFDVVLLMSNLVNTPHADQRHAFLTTCARHVTGDAIVLIERLPQQWVERPFPFDAADGQLRVEMFDIEQRDATMHSATLRYSLEGHDTTTWSQRFSFRGWTEDEIRCDLDRAGLVFDEWLDPEETLLAARWPR